MGRFNNSPTEAKSRSKCGCQTTLPVGGALLFDPQAYHWGFLWHRLSANLTETHSCVVFTRGWVSRLSTSGSLRSKLRRCFRRSLLESARNSAAVSGCVDIEVQHCDSNTVNLYPWIEDLIRNRRQIRIQPPLQDKVESWCRWCREPAPDSALAPNCPSSVCIVPPSGPPTVSPGGLGRWCPG